MAGRESGLADKKAHRAARLNGPLSAVLACLLTASCSSSPDTPAQLGFSPTTSTETAALDSQSPEEIATEGEDIIDGTEAVASNGALAPEESSNQTAQAAAAAAEDESASEPALAEKTGATDKPQTRGVFANLFSPAGQNTDKTDRTPIIASNQPPPASSGEEAESEQAATSAAQREDNTGSARRGFLSAFLSPENGAAKAETAADEALRKEASKPETKTQTVSLVSTETEAKPTAMWDDPLPGVRDRQQLFEINYGSGKQDDGSIDLYEQVDSYQVATAAGLARLAPNGLLKQRESVDVSCFKPQLVHLLKTIERHFGKPVMITSGYRSPQHNRRVRGARNSMHMQCAAADIQVAGVSKWELARFTRALANRGGVGTYCHTKSVHVDVGRRRDWNWRCRG